MKKTVIGKTISRHIRLVLAACAALALCVMPVAASAASVDQSASEARIFAEAAAEFGVPKEILLAVSYHQTRWETHNGEMSVDGGYGPMNLRTQVAITSDGRGDPTRPIPAGKMTTGDFTLDKAAALLKVSPETLKSDARQNIRGGAAVLADKASSLHGNKPVSQIQDWYPAVAAFSGSKDTQNASSFANDVFSTIQKGVNSVTSEGQALSLQAMSDIKTPDQSQVKQLGLKDTGFSTLRSSDGSECPRNLTCRFVPAGYAANSDDPADYGNYDHSNRPNDMKVKYIIIHDTEGSYTGAISHFQDTAQYVSAHYVIRSSDGAVTQMVSTKDTAWHAGDWWVNMHSIGIEHEGYAALGGSWYSEAMYQSSADLVRYLANKYDIPLDRDHIIGHDNVPGLNDRKAAAMHYDPGPYWDWNHYMDLVQGKKASSVRSNAIREQMGNIVTIKPTFAENIQTVRACVTPTACANLTAPSNFIFLRTAPDSGAPLITDILLHPGGEPGTNLINDWTAKAASGQQYALAERKGDWTAIWHSGQKAWFYNPVSAPSATIGYGRTITLKPGINEANVYGGAYPEASVYPIDVLGPVQPKLKYTIKAGQKYVSDGYVPTDYFYDATIDSSKPHDHEIFRGNDKFIKIWYNQRAMFVRASDVIIQ